MDPLSQLGPEIAEFVRRSEAAGAGSPALGDVAPSVSRKAAELAGALSDTGVDVKAVVYPGTVHSFLEAMSMAEVSRQAIAETFDWISSKIG